VTLRRISTLTLTGLAALLLLSGAARADKKGQDLLRCLDKKATNAKDQFFIYDMVVADPGKEKRTLVMHVWIKDQKRLVHFMAPGDVKGMKVLIRSRTQMYVYLKAFRKIRRITSHAKKQSLFGADYNYDDQSTVTYANVFDGQFLKETKTHNVVRAKATPKADSPYGYLDMYLRKKDCLPTKVLYYNTAGKHIKSETRKEYSCIKEVCNAARMKMTDHTRGNHWTEMVRKTWKTNTGVSDRKFSRRALQRSY
jgi:outer membrane lipoprotein-sorting protein